MYPLTVGVRVEGSIVGIFVEGNKLGLEEGLEVLGNELVGTLVGSSEGAYVKPDTCKGEIMIFQR